MQTTNLEKESFFRLDTWENIMQFWSLLGCTTGGMSLQLVFVDCVLVQRWLNRVKLMWPQG